MHLLPVILSGGSGTRLWPLSREDYPKQLLALCGDTTMLQSTALRLDDSIDWSDVEIEQPLLICNESSRFISLEQLRQVGVQPQSILLEPVGRNTAPALTLAAIYALDKGNDPLLLVMPADHVITQLDAFRAAVQLALASAQQDKVVTFGIVPDAPETGYGYIRAADQLSDCLFSIAEFVEKPDLATAQRYLAEGGRPAHERAPAGDRGTRDRCAGDEALPHARPRGARQGHHRPVHGRPRRRAARAARRGGGRGAPS